MTSITVIHSFLLFCSKEEKRKKKTSSNRRHHRAPSSSPHDVGYSRFCRADDRCRVMPEPNRDVTSPTFFRQNLEMSHIVLQRKRERKGRSAQKEKGKWLKVPDITAYFCEDAEKVEWPSKTGVWAWMKNTNISLAQHGSIRNEVESGWTSHRAKRLLQASTPMKEMVSPPKEYT